MEKLLSFKGTCHVILLAKLHDMYLYNTSTFPHQLLKSVSKVALLHRFQCCMFKSVDPDEMVQFESSGQDLYCLQMNLYWSTGLKVLKFSESLIMQGSMLSSLVQQE